MCRVWQSRQHSFSLLLLVYSNATVTSVRRRGKNVDSSSKSNPLRRRGKKLRREGVGVVVEKKKSNFQQKFVWFTYSNNAHRNSVCILQNKQFNKKTKLWKQNGRCLDDVTTAL